jgi:hypothetical protein
MSWVACPVELFGWRQPDSLERAADVGASRPCHYRYQAFRPACGQYHLLSMANEPRHWINGPYAYDSREGVHVQVDPQNQPSAVVRESQDWTDSAALTLALAEKAQS